MLDGVGVLQLWPTPETLRVARTAEEEIPTRAGHVISRAPANRVAHWFRAEDETFTFLAYGTREPDDIAYYPRSNKINFRGVGVIARLENLDYFDGEPT